MGYRRPLTRDEIKAYLFRELTKDEYKNVKENYTKIELSDAHQKFDIEDEWQICYEEGVDDKKFGRIAVSDVLKQWRRVTFLEFYGNSPVD